MTQKMSALLTLCVFGLLTFAGHAAKAQIQKFDPVTTRETFERLRDHPRPLVFKVEGDFQSQQARDFYAYFETEILPDYRAVSLCSNKSWVLQLMIDAALFKNEEEFATWRQERQACHEVMNAFGTSAAFTEKMRVWAAMGEGLSGEMPEEARKDYHDRVRWEFAPEQEPLLNELAELDNEFSDFQNSVPANDTLIEIQGEREEAARKFRAGEISFAEARAIFHKGLERGGPHVVGLEAHRGLPDHLQRAAVLRSLLAKSKGYPTWAAYQLENDEGYDTRYRGVAAQRDYLHRLLENLSPRVRTWLDSRHAALGLDHAQVTASYEELLHLPNVRDLNAYFPLEKVTPLWIETMQESGFTDKTLSQILVDDGKRPQKMTNGAYSAPVEGPHQDSILLDAATLNYIVPPRDSAVWKPGLNFIIQTYKNGGYDDVETMFHEGGHALEFLLKHKHLSDSEAYAYVEVPSTSMEYFLQDAEFVFAKLTPVDGHKPSLEEVRRLIQNGKMTMADMWHMLAQRALVDIDVWDYDYSQPGAMSFVERMELVYKDAETRALENPDVDAVIPPFYSRLGSSHHVSGDVRYIGYVFADLATRQMVDFVTGELEKQSGRSTWLRQPGLAEILGDRFYAQGWKRKFPENIENITGRAFDPKTLIEKFFAGVQTDCNGVLK